MKNALVLSGGSIKGAFQAGAIKEILKRGFKPDAIYGVSTGALNGAFLADRAGRQLLNGGKIDWPKLGVDLVDFWKRRVKKPSDVAEKRWTGKVIADVLFNQFKGLTKTDALKAMIGAEIKRENIIRARDKGGLFYAAGSTDLWSGEIVYAGAEKENMNDFIYASTAVPIAMPWVPVQYVYKPLAPFVDGGIRDVAPLRRAVNEGYENIICIVCQSRAVGGLIFDPGNLLVHIERITDIMINEIVENDLALIKEFKLLAKKLSSKKVRLSKELRAYGEMPIPKVYRPLMPIDIDIMDFKERHIAEMIEMGEKSVIEQGLRGKRRSKAGGKKKK